MSGYGMNRLPHHSPSPKSVAKEKKKKPCETLFNRVLTSGRVRVGGGVGAELPASEQAQTQAQVDAHTQTQAEFSA